MKINNRLIFTLMVISFSLINIISLNNIAQEPNVNKTKKDRKAKEVKNLKKETSVEEKDKGSTQTVCRPYCFDINAAGGIEPSYESKFPFMVNKCEECNAQTAAANNVCPRHSSYPDPKKIQCTKQKVNTQINPLLDLDIKFKSIYFYPWKTTIKNQADLEYNADLALRTLNAHPSFKILITGTVPRIKNINKYADNYILSLKRANTVKDYFLSQGISEEQIISLGTGFQKTSTQPEAGSKLQDKERRADIFIAI